MGIMMVGNLGACQHSGKDLQRKSIFDSRAHVLSDERWGGMESI